MCSLFFRKNWSMAHRDPSARFPRHPQLLLLGLLLAAVGASVFLGRFPAPGWTSPAQVAEDPFARQIVLHLRLPRILAALILGAALSGAGAAMQMLFRNPLVEPGFLGVSQGAAFGAGVGMLFLGGSTLAIQGCAAGFAVLGLALSYLLAHRLRFGGWILRLVLAGIAVSALFSSGLGLLKTMADPLRELPELTFWLMGGLWAVGWRDVARMLPVAVPALLVLWLMRWRISLLSLGDETAHSLGVAAARERALVLLAAVAAVAAVVSVAGVVGWIGLLVPHVARRLVGSDARRSLPASMLLGALFALVCDGLARTLAAGEIPLGILTSLFGAALFLVLMTRRTPGEVA
jgi:iron complex transport system permease protein